MAERYTPIVIDAKDLVDVKNSYLRDEIAALNRQYRIQLVTRLILTCLPYLITFLLGALAHSLLTSLFSLLRP